jgi:sulfonate transport system permease protein
MSIVQMTLARPETAEATPVTAQRRTRWTRPMLGLLLPVGAALLWELAVRVGLSTGRLVPPPSVIWDTFVELASAGELQRHAIATTTRVITGFGLGVVSGTVLGAITGYSM